MVLIGKYDFWFPSFPKSIYGTLWLLEYFNFAYGCICICVCSIILIIICLILQLPFVWGSSLVFSFWIFDLVSLNAIKNKTKQKKKKFVESSLLTRDQAVRLWSGTTDFKTLDYQRTNLMEYQILRTHTKESTGIQDLAIPIRQ